MYLTSRQSEASIIQAQAQAGGHQWKASGVKKNAEKPTLGLCNIIHYILLNKGQSI